MSIHLNNMVLSGHKINWERYATLQIDQSSVPFPIYFVTTKHHVIQVN